MALSGVLFLALIVFSPQSISAQGETALSYREWIEGKFPTATTGLNPELARILANYYQGSFGGFKNYQEVESIRFEGVLRLPEQSVHFIAFKKKPDYCKVVISLPDDGHYVMAYDGKDAWQLVTSGTGDSSEPVEMPPAEALDFIRDSSFGGRLMYPTLPGKKVRLLKLEEGGDARYYNLEVTMPNGQQIEYLIDLAEFKERRQVVTSSINGDREVTIYSDIRKISGMAVPFMSILTVNGEFVHETRILRAETNLGVMPWMFERPSADYIPRSKLFMKNSLESLLRLSEERRATSDASIELPSFIPEIAFPDLNSEGMDSISENTISTP